MGFAFLIAFLTGFWITGDSVELSPPGGNRGVQVRLRSDEKPEAPVIEEVTLYGTSHALIIGIDAYEAGWPPLSGAVADAKTIASELLHRGFSVTLKTNLNSQELKKTLEEFFILQGADPNSRLFVWFAGHGHTMDNEGFLVPIDSPPPTEAALFRLRALPMRRFGELMRLAQSKHVFAVFDSCFSGTVFTTQRGLPPAAVTRATTFPVRQFLTSGDAEQKVSDDGLFRELFLRCLRGEEAADANRDGYLSASELGLFLTDRMTNLTQSLQTPRYGKLRDANYDRGDFIFVLSITQGDTESTGPASPMDREVVFWKHVQAKNSVEAYQAYLDAFPDGTFAPLARLEIEELRPAKKAPEEVQSGRLFVRTKPATAHVAFVTLDRQFDQGMSLEEGRYQIRTTAAGFTPDSRWVTIEPGRNVEISVDLVAATESIREDGVRSQDKSTIDIIYRGDFYGCQLDLNLTVGDRTIPLSVPKTTVVGLPTGNRDCHISGTISCASLGVCRVISDEVLDIFPGAVFYLYWENSGYAECLVWLQPF